MKSIKRHAWGYPSTLSISSNKKFGITSFLMAYASKAAGSVTTLFKFLNDILDEVGLVHLFAHSV